MVSFSGRHYPKFIILQCVRWYVSYALSYRNIEEMMAERGFDFAESVVKNQRYFEKVHFDHFRPMVSYCLNGGELVVDDILLLENIDIELKRIQPLIGVVDLPRINASPSYQHLSTRENIDRVRILYEEDWLLYERIQALHHSLYR